MTIDSALTAGLTDAEAERVQRVIAALQHDIWYGLLDNQVNGHIGPVHHPTRVDLWTLDRPARRRRMLRHYLNTIGHPAGQWTGRRT